ncbi:MAG: tRNA (guanosine(37)-N1)-methyltransferase TrmD [Candidatus Levyibacteriota bacterium]
MNINIISLFPEMFSPVINSSILKRAQEKGKATISLVNLRDFGLGTHKSVDDKPYGGGAGMVLRVDVMHQAIEAVKKSHPDTKIIILDPKGIPFTQKVAEQLSTEKDITLICGHYEGFDERIRDFIDMEISIGDYVLTGGEIPAMAITDAVVRLLPGVLGKDASPLLESFSSQQGKRLLEHAHYTRPAEYKGKKVPEVLLSGHQKNIDSSRNASSEEITREKRPDLLK